MSYVEPLKCVSELHDCPIILSFCFQQPSANQITIGTPVLRINFTFVAVLNNNKDHTNYSNVSVQVTQFTHNSTQATNPRVPQQYYTAPL